MQIITFLQEGNNRLSTSAEILHTLARLVPTPHVPSSSPQAPIPYCEEVIKAAVKESISEQIPVIIDLIRLGTISTGAVWERRKLEAR